MTYWDLIETAFESVDIYNGPESFLQGFRSFHAPVQHLLAAHWCWSEVNNGGFNQFFYNPTGVLAPEAALGFRAIGMAKAAEVVESGITAFGPEYPRDRAQRDAAMEGMPHRRVEGKYGDRFRIVLMFKELDARFYDVTKKFEEVADAFATANAGE